MQNTLKLTVGFLLLILASGVYAQKLPNKQGTSVWAPANIKIDGKATEWNNKFQAYNPVSRVYYTISNDINNIYFIAQMEGIYGNEKALKGGITFSIKPTSIANGKSTKDINNIAVTFPSEIDKNWRIKLDAIIDNSYEYKNFSNDTVLNKRKIDSLVLLINKQSENLFKNVKVIGIKEIPASLISIYNKEGIRVAVQFDRHMQYTYELAIPLKYLSAMSVGDKFKYNIKLNGLDEAVKNGHSMVQFPNPTVSLSSDNIYVQFATDFSGEYTLAKKP